MEGEKGALIERPMRVFEEGKYLELLSIFEEGG